ncbi:MULTISPECIES: hypothetical protein [unclassified Duganella]|uniref:hypothetical protein n=1 Tax=unclassified Duganella TaxID=2636909 RepID=UPI0007007470|nr:MULTISPECIES: hypothetical protein [unclassified Duganella]KQV45404.1 hypothetical protein ASD07_17985 [Duganella sp. Root336D2]KRB93623.1 hypothetical protein ASE26_27640 [Duganella sp. Root198D2]
MKFNKLILAGAVSMALAACGGGGSDSNSAAPPVQTSPVSVVFNGTAAVGAPLAGSVTVKDSKGATKVAQIGDNGAYSVDVTGMTGPFVFRASGMANGRTYTVHSVATSADATGKINITQLTDLIAANVGGQLAADYFDQFDKNAATATASTIDAEVAKLKEKLQPILTALGVDANADLLRTPFTPLTSPLDKALDAIQVSVDTTTSVATISTTANASVITDDLKQKATAETNPLKLAADNISTATTDAPLVKKALTDFIGQFANGQPTVEALLPFVSDGFLHDDVGAKDFLRQLVSETVLVGATFSDFEIHQVDYSDPAKVTARVSFTVKTKGGQILDRLENWKIRKSPTDGVWRLHGNQRALELEAFASMTKLVNAGGTCYRTGLNFNIVDRNPANNTTAGLVDHIVVMGPGLPQAGLRYNVAGWGQEWRNTVNSSTTYVMGTDCSGTISPMGDDGIARLPDNAAYVLTAYDASNAKLSFASGSADGTYVLKVQRRPLNLSETKASTGFPTLSEQSLAALASFSTRDLTLAVSGVNPGTVTWLSIWEETSLIGNGLESTESPTAAGTFSTNFKLTALAAGETVKARSVRIESTDTYRRYMQTVYNR